MKKARHTAAAVPPSFFATQNEDFLAYLALESDMQDQPLLFCGPPGCGKRTACMRFIERCFRLEMDSISDVTDAEQVEVQTSEEFARNNNNNTTETSSTTPSSCSTTKMSILCSPYHVTVFPALPMYSYYVGAYVEAAMARLSKQSRRGDTRPRFVVVEHLQLLTQKQQSALLSFVEDQQYLSAAAAQVSRKRCPFRFIFLLSCSTDGILPALSSRLSTKIIFQQATTDQIYRSLRAQCDAAKWKTRSHALDKCCKVIANSSHHNLTTAMQNLQLVARLAIPKELCANEKDDDDTYAEVVVMQESSYQLSPSPSTPSSSGGGGGFASFLNEDSMRPEYLSNTEMVSSGIPYPTRDLVESTWQARVRCSVKRLLNWGDSAEASKTSLCGGENPGLLFVLQQDLITLLDTDKNALAVPPNELLLYLVVMMHEHLEEVWPAVWSKKHYKQHKDETKWDRLETTNEDDGQESRRALALCQKEIAEHAVHADMSLLNNMNTQAAASVLCLFCTKLCRLEFLTTHAPR